MDKKCFLILIIIIVMVILVSINIAYILLSISIEYANEWNEHDFKVIDKRIEHSHSRAHYIINTVEFGDIELDRSDYYKCFINDNVTIKHEMGGSWLIKINGEPV